MLYMRRVLLVILVALFAAQLSAAYDKRLVHVLEQLRQLRSAFDEMPEIGGAAVGSSGMPHPFYLLFPYISNLASNADLTAMCRDKSPVVRVMAAMCVLDRKHLAMTSALGLLERDSAKVLVFPYGCSGSAMSVAEIVSMLKKDPDFLAGPKPPNKAPTP